MSGSWHARGFGTKAPALLGASGRDYESGPPRRSTDSQHEGFRRGWPLYRACDLRRHCAYAWAFCA
jgi:hypothetical protein